jgi:hypothetical protein
MDRVVTLGLLLPLTLFAACTPRVAVRGSASANEMGATGYVEAPKTESKTAETSVEAKTETQTETKSETKSEEPAAPVAEAPAPATPLPEGCAFKCYIAEGYQKQPLPEADEARFRGVFGATMDQLRACAGPSGYRRKSSPTLNLRFNFQGELVDEGHDFTGYTNDPNYSCYDRVPRSLPKAQGPAASTVRCAEICETPKKGAAKVQPAGGKAQPAAGKRK